MGAEYGMVNAYESIMLNLATILVQTVDGYCWIFEIIYYSPILQLCTCIDTNTGVIIVIGET